MMDGLTASEMPVAQRDTSQQLRKYNISVSNNLRMVNIHCTTDAEIL